MAHLPQNSIPTNVGGRSHNNDRRTLPPERLILNISNPDLRENALSILSKNLDRFQDLAPCLWNSVGTIAALIQEIIAIYPFLSPPTLTLAQSNRVCNALALLQCVASDQRTKKSFLSAQIPMYIYPFLSTDSKEKPFEYLRLSSLGVIGGLVKDDDAKVISYLLSTEIIPLCLRIMESSGTELSKTVATYIILKILVDDAGLSYVCTNAERFYAISRGLGIMVDALVEQPSARLLKHIIRCYLRLSHHTRSCEVLKSGLPNKLKDGTFNNVLQNEPTIRGSLEELLQKLQVSRAGV